MLQCYYLLFGIIAVLLGASYETAADRRRLRQSTPRIAVVIYRKWRDCCQAKKGGSVADWFSNLCQGISRFQGLKPPPFGLELCESHCAFQIHILGGEERSTVAALRFANLIGLLHTSESGISFCSCCSCISDRSDVE